jgi:hypothetical protein
MGGLQGRSGMPTLLRGPMFAEASSVFSVGTDHSKTAQDLLRNHNEPFDKDEGREPDENPSHPSEVVQSNYAGLWRRTAGLRSLVEAKICVLYGFEESIWQETQNYR